MSGSTSPSMVMTTTVVGDPIETNRAAVSRDDGGSNTGPIIVPIVIIVILVIIIIALVIFFLLWVIRCQINKEFWVTSQILTKLGVFVVPMVLTTHTNF